MSKIDLNNIVYDGYDNSNIIVDKTNKLYGKDNIKFHQVPQITDYKSADLLICKDVMQHISYKSIHNILSHII